MGIDWSQFENKSKNLTVDFERLCRLFFKISFFDVSTILHQSPNNPGTEIVPIKSQNKNLSFQSKYFSNGFDYKQLESSVDSTIRNYKIGEIDILYFFSNKDITLTSTPYLRIVKKMKNHSIEFKPVTNISILEEIETNRKMSILKSLYFGSLKLDDEWFTSKLEFSLEELQLRYDRNFNVYTPIYRDFEGFFQSNRFINFNRNRIKQIMSSINDLSEIDNEIKNHINVEINKLEELDKCNKEMVVETELRIIDVIKGLQIEKPILSIQAPISDDDASVRFQSYTTLRSILESFLSYIKSNLLNLYYKNVVFLEGDAGTGKSQLLGYSAEQRKIDNNVVLLLGHKLINENSPWQQIKNQLDINCTLEEFLDFLEGKGASENKINVIIIDAINESAYHKVWQNYLNDLVSKTLNYKYVKLLISIRSTYKRIIFNRIINEKIEKGVIKVFRHHGFSYNLYESVDEFFSRYNIKVLKNFEYPSIFKNPLLLKLFCELNKDTTIREKIRPDNILINLAKKDNDDISNEIGVDPMNDYGFKIIEHLTTHMIINGSSHVNRTKLIGLESIFTDAVKFLNKMLQGHILYSYFDETNNEIISFRYEILHDYFVSKTIYNNSSKCKDVLSQIIKYSNASYKEQKIISPNLIVSLMKLVNTDERYELSNLLLKLKKSTFSNKSDILFYLLEIHKDCLENEIKVREFNILVKKITRIYGEKSVSPILFNVYLSNALKPNHPLNAQVLTKLLDQYPMIKRDYLWTTYINDKYNDEKFFFDEVFVNTIGFENKEITENKKLLLVLLMWFLSSSNRALRDIASRHIIRLLKNDMSLVLIIYDQFKSVNDPYIYQRLLGCIYGSITKSHCSEQYSKDYLILINTIYQDIFNKKEVVADILARDYSRNIIEYAISLGLALSSAINKNIYTPPYNSLPIRKVNYRKVFKTYKIGCKLKDEWYSSALHKIRTSMAPDSKLPTADYSMYGDFGRYVFQSGLTSFKEVNVTELYYYALYYIHRKLKFSNIFTEYDKKISHSNRGVYNLERIGKKYQWIAAYRIWALVSDHYKLSSFYNENSKSYSGPWDPYIRDFDPTLDLVKNERIYNFLNFCNLPTHRYDKFSVENKKWITTNTGLFDFQHNIIFTDNDNCEWISLFFSETDRTSESFDVDYQEVWREAGSFFFEEKHRDKYIELLKNQFFWGRWFYHRNSIYQLFSREYYWSPASNDFFINDFHEIDIPLETFHEEENEILEADEFLNSITTQDAETKKNSIEFTLKKFTSMQKDLFPISVMQGWNEVLWEEQYDMSLEDSSVGYIIPAKKIVEYLSLKQKQNGLWYFNDEMVCADLSLVKNTLREGLYIKKHYLDKFMSENQLGLFWVGLGEQNDVIKQGSSFANELSRYKDFSIFIEYKENKLLKSGMLYESRVGGEATRTEYKE